MSERYMAHPDVLSAHLDGEGVLLHLGSKRYFRLNASASLVWQGVQRGLGAAAIARELAAVYDVSAGEAEREVGRLLETMHRLALLTGGAPGDA